MDENVWGGSVGATLYIIHVQCEVCLSCRTVRNAFIQTTNSGF